MEGREFYSLKAELRTGKKGILSKKEEVLKRQYPLQVAILCLDKNVLKYLLLFGKRRT